MPINPIIQSKTHLISHAPSLHITVFSLTVSQALLISTSASKFPKAANPYEISTWYCCLPCTSFNFLRMNLSYEIYLFIHFWSLPTFCHHQIVIRITICCPEWSVIKYTWMPSLIKIWSVWLWVFPSGDVQETLWMLRCGNIILLTIRFLDVAKFTTLTLLISCKLSFPVND
jgi:hypothetical protein